MQLEQNTWIIEITLSFAKQRVANKDLFSDVTPMTQTHI